MADGPPVELFAIVGADEPRANIGSKPGFRERGQGSPSPTMPNGSSASLHMCQALVVESPVKRRVAVGQGILWVEAGRDGPQRPDEFVTRSWAHQAVGGLVSYAR